MSERVSVTFDEDNRIRILDAEKFKESEKLKSESLEFIKSIKNVGL
jgi:intraflagellar transport protein 20